jgi:D-alanyl-D-alanine carboxypeptidase
MPDPHVPLLRRRALALGAAIAAVAVPAAVLPASAPAAPAAKLQRLLDRVVAAGAPGAQLTVRHGAHVRHLASGVADLGRGAPMRPGHRVRIASVTKSFVATVVLQLAAEHRLTLDDTVERWLPGVVPGGDAIRLRMLLNHTSGLADFEKDPQVLAPFLAGDLGHPWAPRQLVDLAVTQPPTHAPGPPYSYSNTNYVLLGMVVQAATGRSIGAELRHRVFRPLALRSTSFETTPELAGPHAHGYTLLGPPPLVDITGLFPYEGASGAIASTTGDVARFYRALLGGRLLPAPLLHRMMRTIPAVGGDYAGQAAGLGLLEFPVRCGSGWGHNGAMPGFYSHALTSRDARHQSVLIVNADPETLPVAAREAYASALIGGFCAGR